MQSIAGRLRGRGAEMIRTFFGALMRNNLLRKVRSNAIIMVVAKATARCSTVINIPPDTAPLSLESNTQLNVLDGGLLQIPVGDFHLGDFAGTSTNVELNLMGGRIFAGGSSEIFANAGSR